MVEILHIAPEAQEADGRAVGRLLAQGAHLGPIASDCQLEVWVVQPAHRADQEVETLFPDQRPHTQGQHVARQFRTHFRAQCGDAAGMRDRMRLPPQVHAGDAPLEPAQLGLLRLPIGGGDHGIVVLVPSAAVVGVHGGQQGRAAR
ncbi:hypothetical protein AZA_01073 [Nitrospirillum viridazoti Y2]|nr:hypothetical protein AZA_01073 [Nitrospirillum amazonense Y2]